MAFHQSVLLHDPDEFSDIRRFHIPARIKAPYQPLGVEIASVVSFATSFLLDEAQKPS
jgi:hypothetical protein